MSVGRMGLERRSTATPQQYPWYLRKPLILTEDDAKLQYGSYLAGIISLVECGFMFILVVFDIYCLAEATPGSTHYRYFGISFLFVYSGNMHVRNLLILCSVISFLVTVYLCLSSVVLIKALHREEEMRFVHWMISMALFTGWRLVAIIFRSIVNDLYFSYHQAMLVLWLMIICANVFLWLVVLSNYQELKMLRRLEDTRKLKANSISLNTTAHSITPDFSMDSMVKHSHNTSHSSNSTTASA